MFGQATPHQRHNRPEIALPREAEHIWEWFIELDRARQVGMVANPIPFAEIQAFAALNGVVMLPWEVRALRSLDYALLSARKPPAGKGKKAAEERDPDVVVSVKDGAGITALMKGLGAKPAKKKAG
ncbi:phage tail assembly chaperone [Shinella granuli]|uniref:phage tail assembly chaperone n=1 Tax=Shinella granuli TaxID=323621 RepID=UPI003CCB425A